MVVVAHPEAILACAWHEKIAVAGGLGLFGRRAHRVPFALATLGPFGADARSGDAPGAGRLAWPAGGIAERPTDALEPLRLEPQIDRRLVGGGRSARRRETEGEHCHRCQSCQLHFTVPLASRYRISHVIRWFQRSVELRGLALVWLACW